MGIGLRHSIVLALVLCFSSFAIKPAFAQTGPAVTATPPPAYPPPAQQPAPGYPPPGAYPPPPYPPPGYAPPAYPYTAPVPYQYPPQPSGPPPMVHRPRRGLLVGGLVTFGVTWGLALLVSASAQGDNSSGSSCYSESCKATSRYFWIPVAGPIAAESAAPGGGVNMTFAALWSLAEAAGVVMTIFGIVGHDVPDYSYGGRRRAKLDLVPTLSRDSHGMALRATF